MLPVRPTSQFKKDLKRAARQGRDLNILRDVLETLSIPQSLPSSFKDHKAARCRNQMELPLRRANRKNLFKTNLHLKGIGVSRSNKLINKQLKETVI